MIQINKYGEKSVQIIKDGNTRTYNAVFRVRCDQNNIILSSGESNFYATDLQVPFSDLQINGVAPTSALDAYDKLLAFVGLGFKLGGGSSGTTPTLQQVTDIGAVTTNTITIADGTAPAHAVTKRQLDLKANQTDLNTETLARQTADTALQNQINALPLNLISSTAALIPAGTYTRILDLVKAKGLGVWCVNGTDTANYTDLPVGVNTNTHLELKVTEIVAGSSTKNVILKEYNSAKSWHALINKDTVVYIKNWIALWSADNLPYETGVWTPSIAGATVAGTADYTAQKGLYTLIGDICTISLTIMGAFTSPPWGAALISGLPFAASKEITWYTGSRFGNHITSDILMYIPSSQNTQIYFGKVFADGQASSVSFGADMNNTDFHINCTITYKIA